MGLFEGGNQYTAACITRRACGQADGNMDEHIPFCPVCRYVMVTWSTPPGTASSTGTTPIYGSADVNGDLDRLSGRRLRRRRRA